MELVVCRRWEERDFAQDVVSVEQQLSGRVGLRRELARRPWEGHRGHSTTSSGRVQIAWDGRDEERCDGEEDELEAPGAGELVEQVSCRGEQETLQV